MYSALAICFAATCLCGFLSFCLWLAKPESFYKRATWRENEVHGVSKTDRIERLIGLMLFRLFLVFAALTLIIYLGASLHV
jgi:hypothetical protein